MSYYNSIEDCPLDIFRKVNLFNDYKLLLIIGEFDLNKAMEAWSNIYDEYSNEVKSEGVNINFQIRKQIEVKKIEKEIIRNCIFIICELYKAELLTGLTNDYDFFIHTINRYGFNFDKTKSIGEEVQRVLAQSKSYDTQIKRDIKELDRREKTESKYTIDDTITTVEKFMGFQLNEKTTVKKFTSYLNALIKLNSDAKSNKHK